MGTQHTSVCGLVKVMGDVSIHLGNTTAAQEIPGHVSFTREILLLSDYNDHVNKHSRRAAPRRRIVF